MRLYSAMFGARVAQEDFDLPLAPTAKSESSTLHLLKGDRIITYPSHHRDAATFPEPLEFVAGAL
jgi:hypothetical protein